MERDCDKTAPFWVIGQHEPIAKMSYCEHEPIAEMTLTDCIHDSGTQKQSLSKSRSPLLMPACLASISHVETAFFTFW